MARPAPPDKPRLQTGGGLIGKPASGPTSSSVPAEAAISKPMGGKPAWQQLREAGVMPQGSAAANRAAAAGLPGGGTEAISKPFPGPADEAVGEAVGARPEIAPLMPPGAAVGPGPRPMPGFKPAGIRQMTGGPLQGATDAYRNRPGGFDPTRGPSGPGPVPIATLPTAIADDAAVGPTPDDVLPATGRPLPPPMPGGSAGGGGFAAMGRIGAGLQRRPGGNLGDLGSL
jgi:hypothetical protein